MNRDAEVPEFAALSRLRPIDSLMGWEYSIVNSTFGCRMGASLGGTRMKQRIKTANPLNKERRPKRHHSSGTKFAL